MHSCGEFTLPLFYSETRHRLITHTYGLFTVILSNQTEQITYNSIYLLTTRQWHCPPHYGANWNSNSTLMTKHHTNRNHKDTSDAHIIHHFITYKQQHFGHWPCRPGRVIRVNPILLTDIFPNIWACNIYVIFHGTKAVAFTRQWVLFSSNILIWYKTMAMGYKFNILLCVHGVSKSIHQNPMR